MLDEVKDYVEFLFANKSDREKMILIHLLDTEKYVKILHLKLTDRQAPEYLLIAAVAHDIERGFRDEKVYENMFKSEKGFLNKEFLSYHQKRSAEILKEFLTEKNYNIRDIDKVYDIVSLHEIGGDTDTNILKDADSISFLINNVEHFVKIKTKEASIGKVKEKIDWMFHRITFKEAKKIALPFYENAKNKLKQIE